MQASTQLKIFPHRHMEAILNYLAMIKLGCIDVQFPTKSIKILAAVAVTYLYLTTIGLLLVMLTYRVTSVSLRMQPKSITSFSNSRLGKYTSPLSAM